MQKQLANFKRSVSLFKLYNSTSIVPLIIDHINTPVKLKDTVLAIPGRYILFLYEGYAMGSTPWTCYVWIFDKVTRQRLRIYSEDFNFIKENYSPTHLETY